MMIDKKNSINYNEECFNKCMDAYNKQFSSEFEDQEGDSFFGYNCGSWCISVEIDGKSYIPENRDESIETFMDRLERCKKTGRNLFAEEWKRLVYDPDKIS